MGPFLDPKSINVSQSLLMMTIIATGKFLVFSIFIMFKIICFKIFSIYIMFKME